MKRGNKREKSKIKRINNRLLYSLISLLLVTLIVGGVYAVYPASGAGHNSNEIDFTGGFNVPSGNVGIGTTSPSSKLEIVDGYLTINSPGLGWGTNQRIVSAGPLSLMPDSDKPGDPLIYMLNPNTASPTINFNTVSGAVTASKFIGDGSSLTGVTPSITADMKVVGKQAYPQGDGYSLYVTCPTGYIRVGCSGGYSQASAYNADTYTAPSGNNSCVSWAYNNNADGYLWVHAYCLKLEGISSVSSSPVVYETYCGDRVVNSDYEVCELGDTKSATCEVCGDTRSTTAYCNSFCNGWYVMPNDPNCRIPARGCPP
jgi:hypothetical protein